MVVFVAERQPASYIIGSQACVVSKMSTIRQPNLLSLPLDGIFMHLSLAMRAVVSSNYIECQISRSKETTKLHTYGPSRSEAQPILVPE